jgi:hypothetical protein
MFNEVMTILIIITVGFNIINYKFDNYPLTSAQLLLASTSFSMSARLPTYMTQATRDFIFFSTFSNVHIKTLIDKIVNLVPTRPDPIITKR